MLADKPPDDGVITDDDLREIESEGLTRDESLDLFLQWRALGGMNRGIGLSELLEAPGWLIQDFVYLAGQWARAQRRKDKRKEMAKNGH